MFFKCATVTTYLKTYITISCAFVFVVTAVAGLILIISPEEPSLKIGGGSYYSLCSGISLLILAVVTLLSAVCGCICVNRDSRYGLCLYSVFTVVVSIVIIGSASVLFSFTYSGVISSQLNNTLWSRLQSTTQDRNEFFGIQSNYSCCGVNEPSDWFNKDTRWTSNDTLPSSCCSNIEEDNVCTLSESHTKGCNQVLMSRLKLVVDSSFGAATIGSFLLLMTAFFMAYGSLLIRKYQNYDIL